MTDVTHLGWYRHGRLPHFDSALVQQAITFRLADSLPRCVIEEALTGSEESPERRRRLECLLDASHGSCVLRRPACAEIVTQAFHHFAGDRYHLHAWVVMPNHVHVLIAQMPGWRLDRVVLSWKAHSARAINRVLGTSGTLWQRDYWDRYIRDVNHWQRAVEYIENNPVKAGLVGQAAEWRWSSAWGRILGRRDPRGEGQ